MAKRIEKKEAAAPRAPRKVLTKAERVAVYTAAGGRCHVLGTQLGPFDDWHIEDGVLLSPAAKRLKGNRTLEELRDHLADQLTAARGTVAEAELALHNAETKLEALTAQLGHLVRGDGSICFAGQDDTVPVAGWQPPAEAAAAP